MKKEIMKNIIITICVLIISNFCFSQITSDRDLILDKTIQKKQKENYYKYLDNNRTIDHVLSSLFFIYKKLISSQDGSVCSFHPSCSEYGVLSIKEHGLFKGVLKTSDRLLRCNGLSPEKYKFIAEENLLYDPVL